MRRSPLALAPLLLLASCSFFENVDGYAGGPADAAADASDASDAADARPDVTADTFVPADDAEAAVDAGDDAADAADTSVVDDADAGDAGDATEAGDDADALVDATADAPEATTPWRHTVAIDGTNDFSAADEKFATTTPSFDAYVTWDASALYVGYAGPDIGATASSTKWVLVYVDADPGAGTGATMTEKYGTQQQALPTGFGADAYFAWKTDGSYSQFRTYAGGAWSTLATSGVSVVRNASAGYVEMAIPFSALGATPAKLGVVTFMLNEATSGPWTWAGLYAGSFTDGNSPAASPISITHWLRADMASPLAPNAASNEQ